MKKRRSTAYLVISSAQIGMSDDILKIYSNIATYYKAKVIHLGPLSPDEEIRKYAKLAKDIKAAEDRYNDSVTDKAGEAAERRIDELSTLTSVIETDEKQRIKKLVQAFNKVTFVTTNELKLPVQYDIKGAEFVMGGTELSKYLYLSPIPPGSMKSTRAPVTNLSVAYLKQLGKSWIVAHPVPTVECFAKPGLNKAYNYYTVGCLKHSEAPTHTKNQYQFAHMPCAIVVLIDNDTGEFHAKQMHIDYLSQDEKKKPFVIDDGLVFFENKTTETGSDDRATFGTDYHAPHEHQGVIGVHRALNTLHQPAWLIDGGDTADFSSVCHHADGRPGDTEGLRLINDINSLRRVLDNIDNVDSIRHRILIDSNHHEWVNMFCSKYPALIGMCDWKTLAKTTFSDWDVYLRQPGDNKVMWFGDLAIRHGDRDGGHRKAETIFPSGKYLCGHFHSYKSHRRSIQQGCGAKLGPGYVKNGITAWQSQLSTITKFQGISSVSPKIIIHSKFGDFSRFAYRDTIYEVPFYKSEDEQKATKKSKK